MKNMLYSLSTSESSCPGLDSLVEDLDLNQNSPVVGMTSSSRRQESFVERSEEHVAQGDTARRVGGVVPDGNG